MTIDPYVALVSSPLLWAGFLVLATIWLVTVLAITMVFSIRASGSSSASRGTPDTTSSVRAGPALPVR